MSFDKSLYPNCTEGPLGFPMLDSVAKAVDVFMKENTLAKERGLCKLVSADQKELIDGERADVSVVAAEVVDRDKEVVIPGGIDLKHFQKNPVVVFGHDYRQPPVGKAQWIKFMGGERQIRAKTVYAPRPSDHPSAAEWFPDSVYSLVKGGFLPGKSIGFLPLDGGPPTREEGGYKGANWVIRKSVLLEYSVVSIPANQDALVQAVAKGTLTIPVSLADAFHDALQAAKALEESGKPPKPLSDYPPELGRIMADYEAMKTARHEDRLEIATLRKDLETLTLRFKRAKRRVAEPQAPAFPSIKVYAVPPQADAVNAAVAAALSRLNVGEIVDVNLAQRLGRP